ncbi:hypothetical protein MPNT_40032 [Candidatus Methylacidithermus pantelleriae]|uniref:Uncharacterized protein n=1 Tax=Candidatus Methylacidithermus pantelleriae TaxID=2744239 RepID=A0A8J2FSE8_9BACT|nr:hypothetical protein MPNT_40032 [Candidatus Methylacidithermus pantelleriae]
MGNAFRAASRTVFPGRKRVVYGFRKGLVGLRNVKEESLFLGPVPSCGVRVNKILS